MTTRRFTRHFGFMVSMTIFRFYWKDSLGLDSGFSSPGPTIDGRTKLDIVGAEGAGRAHYCLHLLFQ